MERLACARCLLLSVLMLGLRVPLVHSYLASGSYLQLLVLGHLLCCHLWGRYIATCPPGVPPAPSYSFISSTQTSTLPRLDAPVLVSLLGFVGGHSSFRYSFSCGFGFRLAFCFGCCSCVSQPLVCSHSQGQMSVDPRVLRKYTFCCRSPTGPLFQFPLPNLKKRRFLKPSRL